MASDLIVVPNPPDVPKFLAQIPVLGVPEKVTADYLGSVGFKSSNHRYIPGILRKLGFIDEHGTPTGRWTRYRDKGQQRTVMAEALRQAYSGLFATFPDAHKKDTEALRNYFGSKSTAAGITLTRAAATFRALAGIADLDAAGEAPKTPPPPDVALPTPSASDKGDPQSSPRGSLPAVNINIQLHLPETTEADVYEKLFAAMRKHLFE